MPITNIDDNKQLEFGFGDIEISAGLLDTQEVVGVVCFFNAEEPHEIGERNIFNDPKLVKAEDTPVRMMFDKVESIDVVINALKEAKKKMLTGDVLAR